MNNTHSDKWRNENHNENGLASNNFAENYDSKSVESNELSMTEL